MYDRVMKVAAARAVSGALVTAAAVASPFAPSVAAQEIVQTLPPPAAGELGAAMRRLAQKPTDLEALLRAGNASLALRDIGAAAGFFARAAAVAPNDARVLVGQGRVALEQRRPVDALRTFALAEQAGARAQDMAADRALAYDLVGDNAAAQALYRSILAVREDEEVRRRLALSLAISGNRSEFERTLYPLLKAEDRQAFRTRAFGLAILGLTDDAVGIADAMMPTDLALRMAPYLRYMPRLTKAQQAAAGNLGAFPAASEIGRDSADIAGYAAAGSRIAARANASLTPSGAALGPRTAQPAQPAAPPLAAQARSARPAPVRAAPAQAQSAPPAPVAATAVASRDAAGPAVIVAAAPPAEQATPREEPARISLAEAFADLGPAPAVRSAPAAGAVDVARLAAARAAEEAKAKREAEAKAKARREAEAREAKAKAEKAARDAEPARYWVQVGVGRNVDAFAFDWRRLARQADGALDGKGPWSAKYGATNRMLAGPYPSEAAAQAAIRQLRAKDIEALPFKSAQGEKVSKAG
jgi:hypothetical protein